MVLVWRGLPKILGEDGWLTFLIHTGLWILVTSLFAIVCHRLALSGKDSVPRFGISTLGRRELKYMFLLILVRTVSE